MKTIKLPKNLKYISPGLFTGCRSLTEIVLPEKIDNIGNDAFEGTAFQKIVIPAKVKHIGQQAFSDCRI